MRDQVEKDMRSADSDLSAPTNLELLRVNDLLIGLEDRYFADFAEHCSFLEVSKGERVMETGEVNSTIIFVVRGMVRITGASEGMELIYADVGEGHWFGEIAAIDKGTRSADAFALDDVVVENLVVECARCAHVRKSVDLEEICRLLSAGPVSEDSGWNTPTEA